MKKTNKNKLVFEELKQAIIAGIYKPRERLMEKQLADQFQTSRIPIREAIRKLEALGMVEIIPNRGARVTDSSPEEIEALYLVRNHVEQLALKLALQSITPDDLRTLTAINEDLAQAAQGSDYTKILEKNSAFHEALTKISRNPVLIQTVNLLRSKSFLSSHFYWKNERHVHLSISEHRKIIKALRDKDESILLPLVEKHLNNGKNYYLDYLAKLHNFHG